MKVILITPGTGSYYCGVCMRDNALARELIRQGHDAIMVPCYLPLQLDETQVSQDAPTFFGGINVYLQQRFSLFRHTPAWIDRLLDRPSLLRRVGKSKRAGSHERMDDRISRIAYSMLEGDVGRQRKEVHRLVAWLKEEKPDAVWLSTALLMGLARLIKKELGVPVLASLQGEDGFMDKLARPWNRRAWELLVERAKDVDLYIAPSRFYAKLMGGRMRLDADRIRVIPNAVSLDGYGEPLPAPTTPVIGFLARMTEEKGLGLLVEAYLMLKKRPGFETVKLRVAGATTEEDERYVAKLKKHIADAGWTKDVEFLPNIDRAAKITFLKSLTLLSVPAIYAEAFGLYIVEAWAAGVPVVQPRNAAFTELVEATGAGRLCWPESPDDLVSEWSPLLGSPETAREVGMRGRDAILNGEFSLERMAQNFLAATRDAQNAGAVATH